MIDRPTQMQRRWTTYECPICHLTDFTFSQVGRSNHYFAGKKCEGIVTVLEWVLLSDHEAVLNTLVYLLKTRETDYINKVWLLAQIQDLRKDEISERMRNARDIICDELLRRIQEKEVGK